jgi:hypothetical protein
MKWNVFCEVFACAMALALGSRWGAEDVVFSLGVCFPVLEYGFQLNEQMLDAFAGGATCYHRSRETQQAEAL